MSHLYSKPIPINYTKSRYGFRAPPKNTNNNIYELVIFNENKEIKYFKKIINNKYCKLIDFSDKILFSDIKKFTISITTTPYHDNNSLFMEGNVDHKLDSYTKNNSYIYIEFTQNSLGYTICNCYKILTDNNKIFVSPPNY